MEPAPGASGRASDVLIVGAGPVGLTLACELARRGVRVRIIDARSRAPEESAAALLQPGALAQLERLGVAEPVLARGRRTTALRLHLPGADPVDAPLAQRHDRFPFAVTIEQREIERILTRRLAALGVPVERGTRLVGLSQTADAVHAQAQGRGGDRRTLSAAWLVGADGAASDVRRAVGLRLIGAGKAERFLVADCDLDSDTDSDIDTDTDLDGDIDGGRGCAAGAVHTWFPAGAGPVLAFPVADRRARLLVTLTGADAADDAASPARAQRLVSERAPGLGVVLARDVRLIEARRAQAPAYRVGRVFLAGDAAHAHSPAGSQGINAGLADAGNLGWKLAAVIRGEAGERLLDSYERERHPASGELLAITTGAAQVGAVRARAAQLTRSRVMHATVGLAPIQHLIAADLDGAVLSYRGSPIVVGGGRAAPPGALAQPGDLAPIGETALGDAVQRAAIGAPAAHLALRFGAQQEPVPPRATQIQASPLQAAAPQLRIVDAPDPDGGAAASFGLTGPGIAVIRPDGYLGMIAQRDIGRAVARYLELFAGR